MENYYFNNYDDEMLEEDIMALEYWYSEVLCNTPEDEQGEVFDAYDL